MYNINSLINRIKAYLVVTCGDSLIHWYYYYYYIIIIIIIIISFYIQIDKGMYISRKLLFAGMLLKVSGLWARGDTVKSGVVTDSTRVSCKGKRDF